VLSANAAGSRNEQVDQAAVCFGERQRETDLHPRRSQPGAAASENPPDPAFGAR